MPNVTDFLKERDGLYDVWTSFTRNGKRWEFALKQHRYFHEDADSLRGSLAVSIDNKEMLRLVVYKILTDYAQWEPADVLSIELGQWAVELVEMDVERKAEADRNLEKAKADQITEQAKRIKL